MARLILSLLGAFQARTAPNGPPLALPKKTQALLAYLAMARRPVARAELSTLLWGDTGRQQAQQSLRQTLSGLRQSLARAGPVLVADPQSVSLEQGGLQVDATAFEALVRKADAGSLADAATLYRGDLLAGLDLDEGPFEEWLLAQRERLRELAMNGLTQLLAQQTAARALDEAVSCATRLLALDAMHEPAHRALMQLYIAQGRRPAALRQYQTCVAVLRRELGVEPASETQQVYAETLREAATPPQAATEGEAKMREQDRERIIASVAALPFVGREAELERLRRAMTDAFAGRAALVAVSGEAGVGKSRLLRQVAAEASVRGARVLLGRAYRAEQILPLGPWRDALRDGTVVANPEAMLDATDPARLFTAMSGLLENLAAARPLVVMLEDLQWADDMSLRLLAYLGRRLVDQPVLIVTTAREEDMVDAVALRAALADLDREIGVASLVLADLSQEETLALVRALARVTTKAGLGRIAGQVWAASEGNAFMAVEMLRALEEGAASPAGSAASLPERARQVVTGRLERLSEHARGLVGVAAVIGRDSEFALLQRAAQLDDALAAAAVEELVRRRIFRVAGERFEFTHEHIREIVYAELLAPRRRLLHRQVANAIRAIHAAALEPHQATLGAHAFAGELWSEAADCFLRAGEWALARSFNREAAAALERAVAAIDQAPEGDNRPGAIDLRLRLRNALGMSGDVVRGHAPLEEARRLAQALGDPVRIGRVEAHVSAEHWWSGRPVDALASADKVAQLAAETHDAALALAAVAGRGYAFHGMGDYGAAHRTLEPLFAAPAHALYGKDLLPIVSPLHQAIAGLAHCGEFELALQRARDAVARAEALDHRYLLMHASWTLGEVHTHRAGVAAGLQPLQRALGLILDRADFFIAGNVLGSLGYLQVLAGEHEEGIARMRDAVGTGKPKWRIGLSRLVARLAEACLLSGQVDEARLATAQCLELARSHGERGYEAWALRLLGEIELCGATTGEDATAHLQGALSTCEVLGMKPMAAHCHAGLARAHRRRGDAGAGAVHREAAASMYRQMGIEWWPQALDAEALDRRAGR
jgi:DNA-binding SARP family transcriptional activator/tetratricopeptide (TPR) repeat protein